MPAFIANDILRLWRTFCVNYEARTARVPSEEKAKGKLKNYKLKHSRLLTCYSALLYVLAVYCQRQTVTPADAVEMTRLTPTERLEWLIRQPDLARAHGKTSELIDRYERFLHATNKEEKELVRELMDQKKSQLRMKEAYEFGDVLFEVLTSLGNGNRFHRLLIVCAPYPRYAATGPSPAVRAIRICSRRWAAASTADSSAIQ